MENERKDIKYFAQRDIKVENLIHLVNKKICWRSIRNSLRYPKIYGVKYEDCLWSLLP